MLGLAARLGDARLRPAVLLGSAGRHTTVHVRPRVPRDVLGWASLPAAAPPLKAGGGLTRRERQRLAGQHQEEEEEEEEENEEEEAEGEEEEDEEDEEGEGEERVDDDDELGPESSQEANGSAGGECLGGVCTTHALDC